MKNIARISLIVLCISTQFSNIALAGSLIITPSKRTAGQKVQSIQFPSGAKVSYTYSEDKKKVVSKTFEKFKIFGSKSKTIKASDTTAAEDFNYAVLRETYNPVTLLPTISQLLWTVYPTDPKARFEAAYLMWARQIYNTRTNQTGESETQIYSKWIPESFKKLAGYEKSKIPEKDYQVVVDKLLKDAIESRKTEQQLRSASLLQSVIPVTTGANAQATRNIQAAISSLSNCNATVGKLLQEKMNNQSFVFDQEASGFLNNGGELTITNGYVFKVPFTSPALSEKVLASGYVFTEDATFKDLIVNSFKTAETKAFYFGDKTLKVEEAVGGSSFPWAGFTLAHEYGHTKQTRSKDFPLLDRNFDVQTSQRISDGKIGGLAAPAIDAVKKQFYNQYNSIVELSATLFALDAMVTCM